MTESELDGPHLQLDGKADLLGLGEPDVRRTCRIRGEAGEGLDAEDPPVAQVCDRLEHHVDRVVRQHAEDPLARQPPPGGRGVVPLLDRPHAGGQVLALLAEASVERPAAEQVAASEDDFDVIERFDQEVVGAGV